MNLSLAAGLLWVFAGLCGLVQNFIMEPRISTYPKAPAWLLHVYFVTGVIFTFFGMRFLAAWWMHEIIAPPAATAGGVFIAGTLAVYKGSTLINILRQRYPEQVWNRLNKITNIASCSKR